MPLKDGVCKAVNKLMGIEGIPVLDASVAATLPDYVDMNAIEGFAAGCVDASGIGGFPNVFYYAVIEN